MDWSDWFVKPHETVLKDVEDGRRDDFVVIIHPKYFYPTISELSSNANQLLNMLLQSSFSTFIVCLKHFCLTPCKRRGHDHYRSYRAIELGVPVTRKQDLLNFLYSIKLDFSEDRVANQCEETVDYSFPMLHQSSFILHTHRSRNNTHFFIHNQDYSIYEYIKLAKQISTKILELNDSLTKTPMMSVETILAYCNEKEHHPNGKSIIDTYFELMVAFRDVRIIYENICQLTKLYYDRRNAYTPYEISMAMLPKTWIT